MSKQEISSLRGLTVRTLRLVAGSAVVLTMAVVSGCENEKSGSLFDANASAPRPNPTITGIAPTGGAQAAVDTVLITGTNFSPIAAENTVYFDAGQAEVVGATATELRVLPPFVTGDAIKVKVGVFQAELFSNIMTYQLSAAVESFANLGPTEAAGAIIADALGSLFASIKPEGVNARIFKISPEGQSLQYAPETAGAIQWTSLRFGPGGYLYAARNFRAVYRFAPGGGSAAALWVAYPVGVFAADIDFDQNENLWFGGNNTNIYLVRPNATTKTFPFAGNVRSVRVFGGYLYFAASTASGHQIWRASITGEELGTPEVYFDFSAAMNDPTLIPTSITFSSDGYLYIGTTTPASVVVVAPSKEFSTPYRAYASLFGAGVLSLASGAGNALYASTQSGRLIKIWWRKEGAPYYGQ